MTNIKTLAELKKAIAAGRSFTIKKHYIKPELEGQKRTPTKVQTNGFYSAVSGEPNHPVSLANNGKGYWAEYGKSSEWSFADGVCKQSFRDKNVWEIVFE
jgi:hypothetical protein